MSAYLYTDEHGIGHVYPDLIAGYRCTVHGRVCSPYTPVTVADVLARAAKDEKLGDGVFAYVAQAVEDRLEEGL